MSWAGLQSRSCRAFRETPVVAIVVQVALTSPCFEQTAAMSVSRDGMRRALRRAVWYLRCVVGFALVFAGLWGVYGTWGAWALLISPVSIIAGALIVPGVAERMPRRW